MLANILYTSVVWWPIVSRVEANNLMQSLQRSYLRAAVGSVGSTPIEVLKVAICLTPLDLGIIEAARVLAYRLKCQIE